MPVLESVSFKRNTKINSSERKLGCLSRNHHGAFIVNSSSLEHWRRPNINVREHMVQVFLFSKPQ